MRRTWKGECCSTEVIKLGAKERGVGGDYSSSFYISSAKAFLTERREVPPSNGRIKTAWRRTGDERGRKHGHSPINRSAYFYVATRKRQTGGQVEWGVLVTSASRLERQEASTEGELMLTGPSTAVLTPSFPGTLIGPLMAVEKVVKAMKMESVLLSWHSLYHSLLCVYLWILTFSLCLAVLLESSPVCC